MSINCVIVGGNAGQDARLSYTASDFAIGECSMALNRKTSKGDKETAWVRIKLLGRYAEVMVPLIKKGSELIVEGQLWVNEFTAKDGQKKSITEILATSVTLVGERQKATQPVITERPVAVPANESVLEQGDLRL